MSRKGLNLHHQPALNPLFPFGLNLLSKPELEEIPVPELLFGFPVDSFHVVEGKIKPNQNLGVILTGYGVPMATVDQLSRCSEGVFDLRQLRSGQNFYLFQSRDSARKACHFVYEKDPVEYIIFSLSDSLCIDTGRKEVRVLQQMASGAITTSLWNSMTDQGLNPVLALELSEIYAWTIDFFGIQEGDRFNALYEEQFVDSASIGVGPVHAARFEHMGKQYQAFRFFQDGQFSYFDQSGENLRKAFLKAPLKFSRISSRFSGSRLHPVLKIRRPHYGVDYAAPRGTPVVSIGDGTVVQKAYQGRGAGNYLKIKHNSTYTTMYLHLSGYAKGIRQGSRVSQGEVIGYVGSTGLSTGPHLDFRVFKNGTPVDPLKMESPPADPVRNELMPSFTELRDSLNALLDKETAPPSPVREDEAAHPAFRCGKSLSASAGSDGKRSLLTRRQPVQAQGRL